MYAYDGPGWELSAWLSSADAKERWPDHEHIAVISGLVSECTVMPSDSGSLAVWLGRLLLFQVTPPPSGLTVVGAMQCCYTTSFLRWYFAHTGPSNYRVKLATPGLKPQKLWQIPCCLSQEVCASDAKLDSPLLSSLSSISKSCFQHSYCPGEGSLW